MMIVLWAGDIFHASVDLEPVKRPKKPDADGGLDGPCWSRALLEPILATIGQK